MTRVTVRSNADHDRRSLLWNCGLARTDDLGRLVMADVRQIAGHGAPVAGAIEMTAVVYVPLPGDIIEIEELED